MLTDLLAQGWSRALWLADITLCTGGALRPHSLGPHRAKVLKPRLDSAVALSWSSSAPSGQRIDAVEECEECVTQEAHCSSEHVWRGGTRCVSVVSISAAVPLLIQGNEIRNLLNILPSEDSKCVPLHISSDIENIPWRKNFNSHSLWLG